LIIAFLAEKMIDCADMGIQLEGVVDLLKRELTFHTICRQLAYQKIIRTHSKERGIQVADSEIQAEADCMRREQHLESVQKTQAWLQERMITADEWEDSIRNRLISQKLADAMFGEAAIRQFNQRKLDYEKISLYKIMVSDGSLAQELAYQIEEKEISFFEAAHHYDIQPERRHCCGYEGEVSRWTLPPDIAASVFAAPVQTVIGPFVIGEDYGLFFVDEFIEPTLTEETHRAICDRLFYEWLESELKRLET
jgi:parvulin-like peptidyl-prolyl isomerase